MTDNSLSSFIGAFKGGNRAHRYEVSGSIGPGGGPTDLTKFFVRAVSLPPSQINEIRVPYRGRILKWPGDRVYQPWTIRILDDSDANNLWQKFHNWSNAINDHEANNNKLDNLNAFAANDWVITQVDETGAEQKEIQLVGCWPSLVGPIDMDANAVDTLVEFNVVVNYQYYTLKT